MNVRRRIALTAMILVTAWSVWAWAGPKTSPATANESRSASGENSEGPAPINWLEFGRETPPFIAMIVNFGILVAGYYLLGRKPIAAALENRRTSIAKEIEEAQNMKREAEARSKTYQAKLERLEEEVRTTREALLRSGEAERDRIVGDAEAKAERMRADAKFLVDQEVKQIRVDLWRDALESAVQAAEQLLGQRVTSADQERLAEDFLAELGKKAKVERSSESTRAPAPPARSAS